MIDQALIDEAPRLFARALSNGALSKRLEQMDRKEPSRFVPVARRKSLIEICLGEGNSFLTTEENARRFAAQIFEAVRIAAGPAQAVLDAVCAVFAVSEAQLLSRGRPKHVAMARHALCYFLRESGFSFSEIAAFCQRKDHGTAFHAVGRGRKMFLDGRYRESMERVQMMLCLDSNSAGVRVVDQEGV